MSNVLYLEVASIAKVGYVLVYQVLCCSTRSNVCVVRCVCLRSELWDREQRLKKSKISFIFPPLLTQLTVVNVISTYSCTQININMAH